MQPSRAWYAYQWKLRIQLHYFSMVVTIYHIHVKNHIATQHSISAINFVVVQLNSKVNIHHQSPRMNSNFSHGDRQKSSTNWVPSLLLFAENRQFFPLQLKKKKEFPHSMPLETKMNCSSTILLAISTSATHK